LKNKAKKHLSPIEVICIDVFLVTCFSLSVCTAAEFFFCELNHTATVVWMTGHLLLLDLTCKTCFQLCCIGWIVILVHISDASYSNFSAKLHKN